MSKINTNQFKKVIVWAHPDVNHTMNYVFRPFYQAFKYLGFNAYYFDNNNHPNENEFSYEDCLFLTEGYSEDKIPIKKSSTYIVHGIKNPAKYLGNVKRFIDWRYAAYAHGQFDHLYAYKMDKNNLTKLGPCMYYESSSNKTIRYKNDYFDYDCDDYEKIYGSWATNLLKGQEDYNDIYFPREENNIYFSGTISPNGRCENYSNILPFIESCRKRGINFIINDPWSNPLSDEEIILRAKKSVLGVDIRSKQHIRDGYLACRLFKNMSYGHLGICNSKTAYEELEGNCFLVENPAEMLEKGLEHRKDYKFIEKCMQYIMENHTFENRARDLMRIFE